MDLHPSSYKIYLDDVEISSGQWTSYTLNTVKINPQTAGLHNITATGLTPFPFLALPERGHKIYARFMKMMDPLWQRFDYSNCGLTEFWGASFGIYGFKK